MKSRQDDELCRWPRSSSCRESETPSFCAAELMVTAIRMGRMTSTPEAHRGVRRHRGGEHHSEVGVEDRCADQEEGGEGHSTPICLVHPRRVRVHWPCDPGDHDTISRRAMLSGWCGTWKVATVSCRSCCMFVWVDSEGVVHRSVARTGPCSDATIVLLRFARFYAASSQCPPRSSACFQSGSDLVG